MPDPPPALRLAMMAVHPDWQRRGIGTALMRRVDAEAADRGVALWATGRDSAAGFYARFGLMEVGAGFAGALGLPHHVLVRPAAHTVTGSSRSPRMM